ncbi:MAG: PKD repeat protein, partial [Planctomycetota bacterium]
MKTANLILPAIALGAAGMLLIPAENAGAFSTIGGSLSAEGQRDVRVFDNFADSQSNDNVTQDPNFPGWTGVELSMWKAAAEWGSEPFGDGSGDPLGGNIIGSGAANFDAFWAGAATGIGGTNDNIVSTVTGGVCSGGVIAYVESPINNGWRMRFCDASFVFWDGPGDNSGGMDIQGIATHEYGHSLGLGHSTVSGTTMFASTSSGGSSNARTIEADDIAGVQFIYGVASATKPSISSVGVVGDQVTINGSNFSTTGGEVWFVDNDPTATTADPRVLVTGVASTGSGTQIVVTLPANATSGNVAVKQNTTGHGTLSNMYPIDTGDDPGKDPDAGFTASVTSGTAPLFVVFSDASTGTGISSWFWDLGDGTTSTLAFPAHIYTFGGSFDVSLTVTGSNGMDTETIVDFIVVTGPPATASCTTSNGTGANPDIFDCTTDPILGTSWLSQVSSPGTTGLSILFGFSDPFAPVPTAFGELLVDINSSGLLTDIGFFIGGTATHSVDVPNDS